MQRTSFICVTVSWAVDYERRHSLTGSVYWTSTGQPVPVIVHHQMTNLRNRFCAATNDKLTRGSDCTEVMDCTKVCVTKTRTNRQMNSIVDKRYTVIQWSGNSVRVMAFGRCWVWQIRLTLLSSPVLITYRYSLLYIFTLRTHTTLITVATCQV